MVERQLLPALLVHTADPGMNTIEAAVRVAVTYVHQHGTAALLSGLALTVALLLWTVRKATKSERPDKWLAAVSLLIGFAWSAEAMWKVATHKLGLPATFAAFAFTVFESQLAVSMMRAERHYRLHQHPGKHGRTAWLVACVMGSIAALAADSSVEVALRLAVPLLVTQQWWVGMTGDGVTKPVDAITWTWTPRRILVTAGLARPGKHDLATVDRQRQILALAKVSHRLHSTRWRWRRAWCEMRLRRLTMQAHSPTDDTHVDIDDMLDAARIHVERVWRSVARTRPLAVEDLAIVAAARAAADAAHTEARLARAAEIAAVASAQVAHDLADAAVARTAQAAAEAAAAHQWAAAETARANQSEAQTKAVATTAGAETARRREAEQAAGIARNQAQSADRRASQLAGRTEQATTDWQRRITAAEEAAARACDNLNTELQKRQKAETAAVEAERNLGRERERRQQAEQKHEQATQALQHERQRRERTESHVRVGNKAAGQDRAMSPIADAHRVAPAGPAKAETEGGSTQAQRAEWIHLWIERSGRPQDEDGWAALTKAIVEKFGTSDRTARRDVKEFKDQTPLHISSNFLSLTNR